MKKNIILLLIVFFLIVSSANANDSKIGFIVKIPFGSKETKKSFLSETVVKVYAEGSLNCKPRLKIFDKGEFIIPYKLSKDLFFSPEDLSKIQEIIDSFNSIKGIIPDSKIKLELGEQSKKELE